MDGQIREKVRKNYVAYELRKNFVEFVMQASTVKVYVDASLTGLDDPKKVWPVNSSDTRAESPVRRCR
jgi:predicted transport protein